MFVSLQADKVQSFIHQPMSKACYRHIDNVHGLNTYDYGARQHDPILGRWDRIDPLCEKYYNVSPYNYCNNNPICNIDPDGIIVAVKGVATLASNALDIKSNGKVESKNVSQIATGCITDMVTDKINFPTKNTKYLPVKSRLQIRAEARTNNKKTRANVSSKEALKKGKERNIQNQKINKSINDAKENRIGNVLNGIIHGFIDDYFKSK